MKLSAVAAGVAAAAVFLAAAPVVQATEFPCPCGYIGESCSETGYVNRDDVQVPAVVTKFPNGTCQNAWLCTVVDEQAKCVCNGGFDGDLCENKVEIILGSLIGAGIVMPVGIVVMCVLLILRREKKNGGSDWKFDPKAVTQGLASPKALLAYRTAMFLFAFTVQVVQFANRANGDFTIRSLYRFFTVVNFSLLTVYFGIGTYLSAKAVFKPNAERPAAPTRLERLFLIMMEVELPTTVLICVVVWAVLFPPAVANGTPEVVVNFMSFVQHGANVLMMLGDFLLNGLHFRQFHIVYTLIWGAIYIIYHNLIMLVEFSLDKPHTPSYGFLGSTTPLQAAFVVGLLVVCWFFFFLTTFGNRCKAPEPQMGDEEGVGSKLDVNLQA